MSNEVMDYETLIANVINLTKREIDYINLKSSAKGGYYWDIKISCLKEEWQQALAKLQNIDTRLAHIANPVYNTTTVQPLKEFDVIKDDFITIKLSKQATGGYAFDIRVNYKTNCEDEGLAIIDNVNKFLSSNWGSKN